MLLCVNPAMPRYELMLVTPPAQLPPSAPTFELPAQPYVPVTFVNRTAFPPEPATDKKPGPVPGDDMPCVPVCPDRNRFDVDSTDKVEGEPGVFNVKVRLKSTDPFQLPFKLQVPG